MPQLRSVHLTCPLCGSTLDYHLEPQEEHPLITVVQCRHCRKRFGAEVTLALTITTATCRLDLPSTRATDALEELETMAEPEDEPPF